MLTESFNSVQNAGLPVRVISKIAANLGMVVLLGLDVNLDPDAVSDMGANLMITATYHIVEHLESIVRFPIGASSGITANLMSIVILGQCVSSDQVSISDQMGL